jgi:uncharacterized protein YjbI with pentapeptide repeats
VEAARLAELSDYEQAWRLDPAGRPGPFSGRTLTGADVFWLAARALGGAGGDLEAAAHRLRRALTDPLLRVSLDLAALDLRGAILSGADLRQAILGGAHLEDAVLGVTQLQGAFLGGAHLVDTFLDRADLQGAFLSGADLRRASLFAAQLGGASLKGAVLDDAILTRATLDGADLSGAQLCRADLTHASLAGAALAQANLSGATLYEARLERTILTGANLAHAELGRAAFDAGSRLNEAQLNHVALYQTSFDRTNLAVVSWSEVHQLGDEITARARHDPAINFSAHGARLKHRGTRKPPLQREQEYIAAARAYRALSIELRAQGVVRDATRFHFRAEVMSRRVLLYRAVRRLRSPWVLIAPLLFVPWLLSLLLSATAGYGVYHVWRLALTYVLVVAAFAGAYWVAGQHAHAGLGAGDALILSLTSFHGRGLQPSSSLTDTMRQLASGEAVLGLLLEGLLIAAFTRRITGS